MSELMFSIIRLACALTTVNSTTLLPFTRLQALAELWIHLAIPSAGFTQESLGMNFAFQVMRKEQQ
jgi:hypothetical protein